MKNISSGMIFLVTAVVGVLLIVVLVLATNKTVSDKFTLPLTISEYFDYDCSHCRDINPYIKQIAQKYGQDVEVEYIYFPVTTDSSGNYTSMNVALAAEAARIQNMYIEFHDKVFEKLAEAKITSGSAQYSNTLDLEAIAKELGMDLDKFSSDIASAEVQSKVKEGIASGQSKAVTSTPSIFVDGVTLDISKYIKIQGDAFDYTPLVDKIGEIINNIKASKN